MDTNQPSNQPVSPQQTTDDLRKQMSEINSWFGKIDAAKAYRAKIARTYTWKEIVREYHGEFNWAAFGLADIYIPPLNLIFAYVQSEVPSLYLRDPHIKVNPKNEQSIDSARIMEKTLNYLWRHNRIKRENVKNVMDTCLVGHTWFKTGYMGEFGNVEDANGNTYEFVEKDHFFGYHLPWDAVIFNPDALDPPYDCRWIVHEIWAPLDEVKSNPLFKNTDKLHPSNMAAPKDGNVVIGDDSIRFKPNEAMACLYEVWDKKSQTTFTISPGCFAYLRDPQQWPYEMRGFPFSFMCFNPSPVQPFGIPDVFTFRPQVMELMKLRAQQYDHIKRYNRQMLAKKGVLSDEAKVSIQQGVTGNIAEVDGNPQTDIVPVPYPPLQTDIYAVQNAVKEDLINISGQSPQERGATQQTTTRTFAELAQIRRGAENRRSRKIDVVEDFIEDIAGNFVALLQQFADVPFYVKTTGEDFQEIAQALQNRPSANQPGAVTGPEGFTVTKNDIQGEFDLEVVAGSTTPLDREQTLNMIVSLIPELPNLGVMPGGPIVGALGKMLAENLDMPEVIRAMKDELQVRQQQQQQAAQQQQQQQDLMTGQFAAKTQLDAEKVGIKQNELLLEAQKQAYEQRNPDKKKVQGEAS